MAKGFYNVPAAKNEPINSYAPGTPARAELQAALKEARSQEIEVPMYIGGKEITTGNMGRMFPPHDHKHTLGHFHKGDASHVKMAIDSALAAKAH